MLMCARSCPGHFAAKILGNFPVRPPQVQAISPHFTREETECLRAKATCQQSQLKRAFNPKLQALAVWSEMAMGPGPKELGC